MFILASIALPTHRATYQRFEALRPYDFCVFTLPVIPLTGFENQCLVHRNRMKVLFANSPCVLSRYQLRLHQAQIIGFEPIRHFRATVCLANRFLTIRIISAYYKLRTISAVRKRRS